jgi:hypothetical protein
VQNDKKHRPAAKQESKAGPERQASDERRAQNPGKWKLGGALERINHRKRNAWVRMSGSVLSTEGLERGGWEVRNQGDRYPPPKLMSSGNYHAHVKGR